VNGHEIRVCRNAQPIDHAQPTPIHINHFLMVSRRYFLCGIASKGRPDQYGVIHGLTVACICPMRSTILLP